jgi:hypothetical protein
MTSLLRLTPALALALGLAACGAGQGRVAHDDPRGDDAQAPPPTASDLTPRWDDPERQALEDAFARHLTATAISGPFDSDDAFDYFWELLRRKIRALRDVDYGLRLYHAQHVVDDADDADDIAAWMHFRIGQASLNVVCEAMAVALPAVFDEIEVALVLDVRGRETSPLLARAVEAFEAVGAPPFDDHAAAILLHLAGFAADPTEACRATAPYWHPGGDAHGRPDQTCADRGVGCLEAALQVEGAGRDELRDLACESLPSACVMVAYSFLDRSADRRALTERDARRAREFLRRGCRAGEERACLMEVGFRHRHFGDEYRRDCHDGDGLACLKRAELLAEDAKAGFSAFCGDGATALPTEEHSADACDRGQWLACFLRATHLLGATGRPRKAIVRFDTEPDAEQVYAPTDTGPLRERGCAVLEAATACAVASPWGCRPLAAK